MMTCHGIIKRYGSILAADGQVTGLLGPNGAGKSTTLRALAGLTRPDAGTVAVDAIDVASNPSAARARLGILPESVGLYDRLTVVSAVVCRVGSGGHGGGHHGTREGPGGRSAADAAGRGRRARRSGGRTP